LGFIINWEQKNLAFFGGTVPAVIPIFFESKKNRLKKGFSLPSGLKGNIVPFLSLFKKRKSGNNSVPFSNYLISILI
jgi:hypothetical protein